MATASSLMALSNELLNIFSAEPTSSLSTLAHLHARQNRPPSAVGVVAHPARGDAEPLCNFRHSKQPVSGPLIHVVHLIRALAIVRRTYSSPFPLFMTPPSGRNPGHRIVVARATRIGVVRLTHRVPQPVKLPISFKNLREPVGK